RGDTCGWHADGKENERELVRPAMEHRWQARVNLREPSAHLRHDLGLRQRRANHQGRVTVGTLIEWKEHRCPWSLGERIVLSIFDDADNFVRKFFAPQKPAPKGGGVSKHRAGEGLVHDRDLRALGIV